MARTRHEDGMAFIVTEKLLNCARFNKYKDTTWHNCETKLSKQRFLTASRSIKRKSLKQRFKTRTTLVRHLRGRSKDRIFLLDLEEACKYFGDSTDKLHNRKQPLLEKNRTTPKLALAPLETDAGGGGSGRPVAITALRLMFTAQTAAWA